MTNLLSMREERIRNSIANLKRDLAILEESILNNAEEEEQEYNKVILNNSMNIDIDDIKEDCSKTPYCLVNLITKELAFGFADITMSRWLKIYKHESVGRTAIQSGGYRIKCLKKTNWRSFYFDNDKRNEQYLSGRNRYNSIMSKTSEDQQLIAEYLDAIGRVDQAAMRGMEYLAECIQQNWTIHHAVYNKTTDVVTTEFDIKCFFERWNKTKNS